MGQVQFIPEQKVKMTAAEAITQVRTMFNRNRVAVIYNKLGEEPKRIICFAAGLQERDKEDQFEKYNKIQRASIHLAIKQFAPVFTALSQFSLTEFNK
ncbi:hypothetical protein [Moritella sp. Urea-trap-13]|uniref:hypothetical protein n=1 Tax=Moritella sp. Urea-trap-13 TaxID=2058327 RepID=UPI000C334DEA|nr:hypothetical protein [Moritella sp. Urea-trap-13]PKH06426.1 hypothetical protein CXF93_10955 [Moritella sp. Urea-trap-13]